MNDREEMLVKTGGRIAALLGEGPGRADLDAQRAALIASSRGRARGRWRGRALLAASLALAVAVAAALSAPHLLRPASMQFWVGAGRDAGVPGAWFSNDRPAPLEIAFADGSTIRYARGASGRVLSSAPRDVHLLLDAGAIDAEIKSAGRTAWVIDAGPYHVRVTGTAFTMSWTPGTAELVLAVERGTVVVNGLAGHEPGLAIGGGRRLSVKGQVINVSPAVGAAPADVAMAESTPDLLTPPNKQEPALKGPAALPPRAPRPWLAKTTPGKPPAPPPGGWLALHGLGRYDEARDGAVAEGFDALLTTLGADDLWALAESARYARDLPRMHAALGALRGRFPGSGPAKTAAFLLGRVAVELEGSPPVGARWFATYLREHPGGPLDEEAAGRLVGALLKAGDAPGAAAAAQEYLARYPKGIFAGPARAALRN